MAHEVSLWVRQQGVPATTFIGKTLEADGFTFKVNKAMALAVQQFVDYCAAVPGHPFWEVRVSYDEWIPGGFGTADDIRIADGRCTVTDLKFGKGYTVYAKENEQLKLYALGVYAKYRWAWEFHVLELRIAQPRSQHFDTWTTTIADVLRWTETVAAPAARRALLPDAPFRAGSWCKFCRIRDDCLVRSAWMREQDVLSSPREDDFNVLNLED